MSETPDPVMTSEQKRLVMRFKDMHENPHKAIFNFMRENGYTTLIESAHELKEYGIFVRIDFEAEAGYYVVETTDEQLTLFTVQWAQ